MRHSRIWGLCGMLGMAGACSGPSTHESLNANVQQPAAIVLPAPVQSPVAAQRPPVLAGPDGFQAYLRDIRMQASAAGVRAATLDSILPTLSFNQRVINFDRAQPDDNRSGASPLLSNYLARRLDPARINGGRTRYARLQPQLMAIESRFGVPGSILLGIWGMETSYGAVTGSFDLFQSLASLAYDGRRRELFNRELIAALQIVDRGLAPRSAMTGSWAGAMGNPQFLPSSYLASAVDGDGDGRADIWTSEADTLASIANYLTKAGWKRGEPWGLEVAVPGTLNRGNIANDSVSPSCPRVHARHSRWLSITEWKALGLSPAAGRQWPVGSLRATLIEADGPGGRAFLAFDNYRALLSYNCSNYYAISVGLLADAISG